MNEQAMDINGQERFRRMILDTISETKKYVSFSNRMYRINYLKNEVVRGREGEAHTHT